jgi:hypothetical protein
MYRMVIEYLAGIAALLYLCDRINKWEAERGEVKRFEDRFSGRAEQDRRRQDYANAKFYECIAAGGSREEARAAHAVALKWAEKNIV